MTAVRGAGDSEGAAAESALDARWMHDVRIRAIGRRGHASDSAGRWRRVAWIVALALHLVLILALRISTPPPADAALQQAIEVDLLPSAPAMPPEPEPPVRPTARARAPAPPRTSPTPAPESASAPEQEPPAEPRLFAPDGTALIPDDLAAQLDRERQRAQGFIANDPVPSPLFARKRPLKVRPNHFAQYWNGTDGMPLHERIWRYVTFTHEFTAPWGGRWKCAYVLMLVACADVPDKPWIAPQTWKPASELDEE